ncbi:MAG: PLP-dependent transferase, partial [Planctomycetota bacterium]
ILVYGLPTLALRLKRQQYSALKVAGWLEQQPDVARVVYPGLESFPQKELARRQMVDFDGDFAPGNMIFFELDPRRVEAEDFIDAIAAQAYSVTLAVSLGHTKTLIEMPASMTHSSYTEKALTGQRSIRLSIGLESPGDIIRDLGEALAAVKKRKKPAKAAGKT